MPSKEELAAFENWKLDQLAADADRRAAEAKGKRDLNIRAGAAANNHNPVLSSTQLAEHRASWSKNYNPSSGMTHEAWMLKFDTATKRR